MKAILLSIATVFLFSCNKTEQKNETLEKENTSLQKEVVVQKEQAEVPTNENSNSNSNSKLNVAANLIHCQNEKFIIRVDRMENDDIQYKTWNKPKSENDKPDLLISNGEIDKQGTMGGYIYTFVNGDFTYVVNDKQMGETKEAMGTFLKISKNGNSILSTKMRNIN